MGPEASGNPQRHDHDQVDDDVDDVDDDEEEEDGELIAGTATAASRQPKTSNPSRG